MNVVKHGNKNTLHQKAGRYTKKSWKLPKKNKQQQIMTSNSTLTYFGIMFPLAVGVQTFVFPV